MVKKKACVQFAEIHMQEIKSTYMKPLPLLGEHCLEVGGIVYRCTSQDGPGNDHEYPVSLGQGPNSRGAQSLTQCHCHRLVSDDVYLLRGEGGCGLMVREPSRAC
jgi:hypothetical protein